MIFDSTKQTIEVITAMSPQDLLKELSALGEPIDILAIHPLGCKTAAYFTRAIKKIKKPKGE